MALSPCPPRERLLLMLQEALPAAEAETVTSHADACPACQRVLEELTAGAAELRARLQPQTEAQAPPSADLPGREPGLPEVAGYEVLGVLGRGGEGVVYRARHRALGRLVALKLIRVGGGEQQLQRFRQEAELLARLSHPHIVQIYEVGEHDGLPFFALEYVAGGSLGQRLTGQPLPGMVAARLVETVAHAVEAAHRAGVIHRDLKPANILLQPAEDETAQAGREPEEEGATLTRVERGPPDLQRATPKVSDFGLGKVVQVADGLTNTGTVLGTPEYMAPEQAQGRTRETGSASDVYALGGILYQLLTGRPPFVAAGVVEVLLQVVHADPLPPRRLNPGVPRELETICLKCLQKEPARRYGTARELADDLGRFQRGEPIRARPVGAVDRALKWVRRNPAGAGLMAALLFVALIGGSFQVWSSEARAKQMGIVTAALEKCLFALQAGNLADARNQLERAEQVAGEGPYHLVQRIQRMKQYLDVADTLGKIRLERIMVVEVMGVEGDSLFPGVMMILQVRSNTEPVDREYAGLFVREGLDVLEGDPREAAKQIQGSALATWWVAALDDWALATRDEERRKRLLEVARAAAQPSGWGDRFRDPAVWRDRAALEQLAGETDVRQSPQSLTALAEVLLRNGGDPQPLLQAAQVRHAGDFWLNFLLGKVLLGRKSSEAVGYFRAALVVRPDSPAVYTALGNALRTQDQGEQAIACYRRALELDPEYGPAHYNLGIAWSRQREPAKAIECYHRAIQLNEKDARAHNNLGTVLHSLDRLDEAIRCYDEALARDPTSAQTYDNLGTALRRKKQWARSICCYRRAVELDPGFVGAHVHLGTALRDQGQLDAAISWYEKALQLDPGNAMAHYTLGVARKEQGRWDEAIRCYRRSIELKRGYASAYDNLGNALRARGRLAEAIHYYQKAVECDPESLSFRLDLGSALKEQGRLGEAICCYLRALELDPGSGRAHRALGNALSTRSRRDEAIACFRKAIESAPRYALAWSELGDVLQAQARSGTLSAAVGDVWTPGVQHRAATPWLLALHSIRLKTISREPSGEAICCYLRALELEPGFGPASTGLGRALRTQGQVDEAARCYQKALEVSTRQLAARPGQATDWRIRGRYHAACAAVVLADLRQENGRPVLSEQERAGWRRRALTWLRADLTDVRQRLHGDQPADEAVVRKLLRRWQQNLDLDSVRSRAGLSRLSNDERQQWLALWQEVRTVLAWVDQPK